VNGKKGENYQKLQSVEGMRNAFASEGLGASKPPFFFFGAGGGPLTIL